MIDLHTHTISSGHAYSTLEENIKGAKERKLKYYGVSDHAPTMPGAPHLFHFVNLKVIPKEINGIRILKGIEANILDFEGRIDADDFMIQNLDYVIASLHPPTIDPGNKEENTNAIIKAMENPRVNIIGHPDDARYPLDYEKIVIKSKETKTLLEVNNSSFNPMGSRVNAQETVAELLKYCMKYNVPILCGSDAHISYDVGNFQEAYALFRKISFPSSLIVNENEDLIKEYLL